MMNKIKCAVIGVGYLGRFHAQKYAQLSNAELIAVCDLDPLTAKNVAKELNVSAYNDYRHLLEKIDAVSIAATTNQHYLIAKDCLAAGIHVLLEKPITETVEQAKELIDIAKKNKVKLQIGHLERFNPARLIVDQYLTHPHFIESNRLSLFNPRSAEVNVVLDLMIHDIDLIQSMVCSPIKKIDAKGEQVFSSCIDIANARIYFESGCVANVTASRVNLKIERKTRIFQLDSYLSIDYHKKQFALFKPGREEIFPGIANIIQKEMKFENSDALLEEIKAFLTCIEQDTKPLVDGEEGLQALAIAAQITQLITETSIMNKQLVSDCVN